MKKQFLFLAIGLVFANMATFGQKHLIGVKAGAGCTNMFFSSSSITPIWSLTHKFKAGFSGGLTYEYKFKDWLSLETGLMYQQFGFQDKNIITFTDLDGNELGTAKYRMPFRLNYLSIPIKVNFIIGKTLYGFGSVGIVPAVLVNSNYQFILEDDNTFLRSSAESKTKLDDVSRFDLGVLVELGVGYKFCEKYHAYFSAGFQPGVLTTSIRNFYPVIEAKNYGILFSFGFKYTI